MKSWIVSGVKLGLGVLAVIGCDYIVGYKIGEEISEHKPNVFAKTSMILAGAAIASKLGHIAMEEISEEADDIVEVIEIVKVNRRNKKKEKRYGRAEVSE